MVAKFVSVEQFAIRAGLGSVDDLAEDVQNQAQRSIEGATTHLISILRTEFDTASVTDRYYVDTGELPFVGEFPRFFLSQGFVTTAESAMVLKAEALLPDLAGSTAVDASYLVLNATKGTLLITGTDKLPINVLAPISGDRYFAQIEYTAGFAETADAFGTIYTGAPTWLVESAVLLAQSIFSTGKPCKDGDTNAQGCPCSIESLVNRHIRFAPSALKPMS